MELMKVLLKGSLLVLTLNYFSFYFQSETLLDLLGGGPTPEPTPAPVQPPAPAASSGGDLLDLLGDLDLGSTNAGLYRICHLPTVPSLYILFGRFQEIIDILYSSCPGPPPMNMVAPSPAMPNLLDGGGPLNPTPSGMPAQLQLNHEPIAPQNQTPNFTSGLYIE